MSPVNRVKCSEQNIKFRPIFGVLINIIFRFLFEWLPLDSVRYLNLKSALLSRESA